MAQIVPKLNLNKTPGVVESNSLIFAKNIRLDVDTTIHRDYGILPMSLIKKDTDEVYTDTESIIGRIKHDIKNTIDDFKVNNNNVPSYYTAIYGRLCGMTNNEQKGTYNIVGVIPNSNEFYIFISGSYYTNIGNGDITANILLPSSCIIVYDEKTDKFSPCNCNWTYSGGDIDGCVINNLRGEKILNIGETNADDLVPLKCINLSQSKITDDETIYTQTPNIPITNLLYTGKFNYVIPNGVYQFFIRYKIRDDFYTDWFPASKELFAGNTNSIATSFGSVKYVNTHKDADNSFTFDVEHLIEANKKNYKSFQIGFILSHDDSIVARAWKHFDLNVEQINFDYDARDAEEIEVIDLIKPTYQIYNVGNITNFKNKLYISNYTETDFNDRDLVDSANKISIELKTESVNNLYEGEEVFTTIVGGKYVIDGFKIDGTSKPFSGNNGIFHDILNEKDVTNFIRNKISIPLSPDNDFIDATDREEYEGSTDDIDYVLKSDPGSVNKAIDNAVTQTMEFVNQRGRTKTYKNHEFTDYCFIKLEDDKYNFELNNVTDVINAICSQRRYLDINGDFVNDKGLKSNTFVVTIVRGLTVNYSWIDDDTTWNDKQGYIPNGTEHYGSAGATYEQKLYITFKGKANKFKTDDNDFSSKSVNYTTLIPYQEYKFYIHYVKASGEVTNGYYCKNAGTIVAPYQSSANNIIYPVFKNIRIPKGYVAYFFSILHVGNTVSTIFDLNNEFVADSDYEGQSVDVNTALITASDKLHIQGGKDDNGTEIEAFDGVYHYSSDNTNIKYFGGYGVIHFTGDKFNKNNFAYLTVNYKASEAEDAQLIKCTPYLNVKNADKNSQILANMNLLGYICEVAILDKEKTTKYYTDGSTVNYKHVNDVNDAHFIELKAYTDDADNADIVKDGIVDKKDITLEYFDSVPTKLQLIYSNFNLNYLVLTEDPVESFKSYYKGTSEEIKERNDPAGTTILRLFKSLTMSSIYELPSMYRSYTRKTYSTFKENEIVRFDNTVRSSILEGDENYVNVFKFHPNDYYNIPTNRGIIINLVAVGDAILVHTQDSMFKFMGSNTLQSSDGEILQTESQPFETGVAEMFGSDFGFAGLQDKKDSIITENGYIFFDRDSKIVYMYSGNGQIVKLSDSIEKLFHHRDIKNICFANDFYNNRFFMTILFIDKRKVHDNKILNYELPVTLSFNFIENVRSFVSLHDFYYYKAFNTKTKCYFFTRDFKDICKINKDKKLSGKYTALALNVDVLYPSKSETTELNTLPLANGEYKLNHFDSIIDVIVNDQFEILKTLNAVSWCGSIVEDEFPCIDQNTAYNTWIKLSEDLNNVDTCQHMRIYTDTCLSPLIDFTARQNDKLNNYKYPSFNQGYWTFNYFRNIQNSNGNTTPYKSDENSLIEGKYFVIRFVFDKEFKLERLNLNYNTNNI